jgi:hypothetical protein
MIGEQTFDALGHRWRLILNNSAQCLIEERYDRGFFAVLTDALPNVSPSVALAVSEALATGKAVPDAVATEAAAAMKGMRLTVLRDLAWAGLQRHHAGTAVEKVSDMIDDLGFQQFGEIIGKAVRAAQGQQEAADATPGKAPRGRKPPAT